MSLPLSRRAVLAAGAAAPFALSATQGQAAAPMLGAGQPLFNRFKLGGFEVTTLLAASSTAKDAQNYFGMDVDAAEFKAVSDANFLPVDTLQFFFTPTIVNTGNELVLFDTGLDADAIVAAVTAAGYAPEQVDKVVITHMHGDHVGGLSGDSGETFANAAIYTGATEFDFWAGAENGTFDGKVKPLAEKTTMLSDGGAVASGITAMDASGHTPGHMTYMLESEGKALMIGGDFTNHYVWSLAYPDWEMRFDMDKPAAAATRRRILGMLAADKLPFIGYHMPFPGLGYVETREDGFRYVPASYQMMLG
ncbi:metallo-beta-lactamase [Actibacterium mucosum KCTC 23349]|uniref:Metallo-beta-lactamase n=1 Tax=Actibacterium mucosum KCTC 23349 TaxID=1454373 RepID=A0A037ZIZ4_9RHOB|nr:MBL fold metallo-hydrolase [Actibacterium mucosum]KAJ56385.1 metallo-beta-lactamase [Actibacterium mucosum KCTC 23349]